MSLAAVRGRATALSVGCATGQAGHAGQRWLKLGFAARGESMKAFSGCSFPGPRILAFSPRQHSVHQRRACVWRQGLPKRLSTSARTGEKADAIASASTTKEDKIAEKSAVVDDPRILATYVGPLSKTFRRLKIFSLSSLALSTALSPAILLAPAEVGLKGRLALCFAALSTSGTSTALISWIAGAYTTKMRLVRPSYEHQQATNAVRSQSADSEEKPWMQIENTSWRLQKLQTTIYDLSLLRPTQRPFATWELSLTPEPLALPALPGDAQDQAPHDVVISETRFAQSGKLRGRLVARYSRDALTRTDDGSWKAEGRIMREGKPCRHFQVHEAMLGEEWQVLD